MRARFPYELELAADHMADVQEIADAGAYARRTRTHRRRPPHARRQ